MRMLLAWIIQLPDRSHSLLCHFGVLWLKNLPALPWCLLIPGVSVPLTLGSAPSKTTSTLAIVPIVTDSGMFALILAVPAVACTGRTSTKFSGGTFDRRRGLRRSPLLAGTPLLPAVVRPCGSTSTTASRSAPTTSSPPPWWRRLDRRRRRADSRGIAESRTVVDRLQRPRPRRPDQQRGQPEPHSPRGGVPRDAGPRSVRGYYWRFATQDVAGGDLRNAMKQPGGEHRLPAGPVLPTSGRGASTSLGTRLLGSLPPCHSKRPTPYLDVGSDYDDVLVTLLADVAASYVEVRTLQSNKSNSSKRTKRCRPRRSKSSRQNSPAAW